MACEIPIGIIRDLQISLRNGADISSYDPTDASLPDLPSGADTFSRLSPSPPHLRCNHCSRKLLRGANSPVCVFCGREQWIEAPPSSINFRSTTGYKLLLESLQLDESEVVELFSEAKESGKLRKTSIEVPISEILNLEIRWHPNSELLESADISSHMDTAFRFGNESEKNKAKGGDFSRFGADDWFQDDPRSKSNDGASESKTTVGSSNETIRETDTEMVMSQMHYLSFMLDSNLAVTQQSETRSNVDR